MDFNLDDKKSDEIKSFLEEYICILPNGKLDFKSSLEIGLKNFKVSKEDSIFILLKVMHEFRNSKIKYENISSMVFNLIRRIENYNSEGKFNYKYSYLLNKPYKDEFLILLDYVEKEYCNVFENQQVDFGSNLDKMVKINIKNNLIDLTFNDLCYILDLDPEFTSDTEKNLKNILVEKLMLNNFDYSVLNDFTPDSIKNYLNNYSKLKKSSSEQSKLVYFKNINHWLYELKDNLLKSKDLSDFSQRETERKNKSDERKLAAQKRIERNKKVMRKNENIHNKRILKKEEEIRRYSQIQQEKIDEGYKNVFYYNVAGENGSLRSRRLYNQNEERKKESQKHDEIPRKNHGGYNNHINEQSKIDEKSEKDNDVFNAFLDKIKELNNKPISEWFNLDVENYYLSLVILGYGDKYTEIKKFKIYYESLNKYKVIKENENNFRQFISILNINNQYYDYDKRQILIQKYSKLYKIVKDMDELFLNKIYPEINYLKQFIEGYKDLLDYTTFQKTDDKNIFKKINQRYIHSQISKNSDLFEDITDPNKKIAIVMDEKNTKIIAGAGTGKTFTIQSKVKYLVESIGINPDKILCLCYTHKSAAELNERVNSSLKDSKVEVCTFHEFARRVDSACGGIKSTNRYLLDEVIRNYFKDLIKNPLKSNLLMEYFAYYINPNVEVDFKTLKEFENGPKYPTLQQKYYIYGINEDFNLNEKHKEEKPKNMYQRAIMHYCNFSKKTIEDLINEANFEEIHGIEWKDRKIGKKLRKFYNCLTKTYDDSKALKYFNYVLSFYSYFGIEIESISDKIDKQINLNKLSDSISHQEIESISYDSSEETLQGEKVKSLGEFIIANYLFMHNINYEYEKRYERNYFSNFIHDRFLYSGKFFCLNEFSYKSKKDIVEHFIRYERRKATYKPDFYLPDYDIYLEHFGIDENGEATWLEGEEKEEYESLVKSKRVWHELYGTKLIETYSYYVRDNTLPIKLEEILKENNVTIGKRNPNEILEILLVNNKVGVYNRFSKLIKNFINIFESNHFSKNDFKRFEQENNLENDLYTRKRQELFLNMVNEIYDIYYEKNQSNDIDHNREISNALELIKNQNYTRKFDYILIDEYQDINYIRCELIQELQKNSNAKVFVVGDDWQSIYGFSGSNVNLFIDFDKFFPNAESITLSETRRNSQIISDVGSKFIQENPSQEPKKLKYVGKFHDSNPIRVVPYFETKYSKPLCLGGIIDDIIENKRKDKIKILILGRMNDDIDGFINNRLFKEKNHPKFRKIVYSKDKTLDITFMSIHQSKGLEYDEVIVLNFEDEVTGFPSQINDDPILKFVKNYDETYRFAEERRLLYVALTRTRHNVYLVYPKHNPSVFIKELKFKFKLNNYSIKRQYELSNDIFDDNDFFERKKVIPTDLPCPGCENGKISVIILHNRHNTGKTSVFVGCSDYCKNYIGGPYLASIEDMKYIEKCPDPDCPGVLVRQGDILKCSMNYHGGCMQTKELKLDKDDLKYKDYEE